MHEITESHEYTVTVEKIPDTVKSFEDFWLWHEGQIPFTSRHGWDSGVWSRGHIMWCRDVRGAQIFKTRKYAEKIYNQLIATGQFDQVHLGHIMREDDKVYGVCDTPIYWSDKFSKYLDEHTKRLIAKYEAKKKPRK